MEEFFGQIFNQLAQIINWENPSWDLFIILFFVAAALIYGVSLGRDRIIVILVSIYMALAVINFAPFVTGFTATINIDESFAFKITTFLGVFIVLFFFLSQSALLRTLGHNAAQGAWWQVIIFSILQAGLLICVTLSFLPQESINSFADLTRNLFVNDLAKSVWIIAPVLAMAFMPGLRYDD